MSQPKADIQLVLDFDGTITTEDTTAIIGARCLAKARELTPSDFPSGQLTKPMSYYSDKYFQEYRQWKESTKDSPAERSSIRDEVAYLSQSRSVELNSFLRVRNAVLRVPGRMRDFEHDEQRRKEFMLEAGREAVRNGDVKVRNLAALTRVLADVDNDGSRWGIVSVSWSRRFIIGVLLESGLVIPEDSENDLANKIKANELLAPLTRGELGEDRIVCSALDKQTALQRLLADWNAGTRGRIRATTEYSRSEAMVVYIGDSGTDIGCLTHASVGLLVCEDPDTNPVVHTLRDIGVACAPSSQLPSLAELAHGRQNAEAIVYLIKGFEEVEHWLHTR